MLIIRDLRPTAFATMFLKEDSVPRIPNFPQDLLDQHHQWHEPTAHPNLGVVRLHPMGSKGGGTEFLMFHRNFVAQVLAWYNTTTFVTDPFDKPSQKSSLVSPWTAVPGEMRALPEYTSWKTDEIRLETGSPNFDSDDDLGFFIESRIHNLFLHGAAARAFSDPDILPLHSPQTSLFYKLHGLVDYWWSKWQRRNLFSPNRPVPSLNNPWAGAVVFFPDRPVPGLFGQMPHSPVGPREITSLIERVTLLEVRAFPMRANLETSTVHPADKKARGRPDRGE
jgi:hypothetical protein